MRKKISDDEDDTHPNIDTPSLFRWRHQARLDRMAEFEREREELKIAKQCLEAKQLDLEERHKLSAIDVETYEKLSKVYEEENRNLKVKEDEFCAKERKMPWNVDTISKPGFAKTVLNKQPKLIVKEELTDEEREENMKLFIKKHEKECKEFGMLRKFDDSKRFLSQRPHLVGENLANYLVLWAINLEVERKHDLMTHVAHQCVCIQYLLELSKQLDVQPQSCVNSFFSKIQMCPLEYKEQFEDEVELLIGRIEKRAREKLESIETESVELNKEERIGPGGLDPVEVFAELPDVGDSLCPNVIPYNDRIFLLPFFFCSV